MCCQMGWIGCAIFQVAQKAHQVDMKNVAKSSKHFFGYFNTLETHSDVTSMKYEFFLLILGYMIAFSETS